MRVLLISTLLLLFCTYFSDAQNWYQANNPFGGNILSMAEASDGALLCGTTRGLYRSVNNGETWQQVSGEYDYLPVPDVNYTSSGMYISLFSYFLRRSYDAGQTWETIPAQDWTSLNRIIVNDAGQIFLNTNNSIWKSSDEGNTWTQLVVAANTSLLNSLDISPDGELYAGTFNKKIYRSSDNGDNWEELYTTAGDVRTFAFDGNNTVYAGTSFSGLYKSTDNGDTWDLVTPLPGTNGALDLNVNSLGEVFAAGFDDGVYKSSDGGTTWEDITADLTDPSVRKLFLNSADDLFAGTQASGLHRHTGSSWISKNQGITAIFINRFTSFDGVLYACTDYGVYISEDGGQTWQQSILGMDDPEVLALTKAPNGNLYAGGEMLYTSADGINWNNISQSFPGEEVTATDLLVEPGGRVVMATDEYGICYSDDQGQSWTYANTGLSDITMAFIRRSPQGYLFTADGYNLYRSDDLSASWQPINNGLTDTDIVEFTAGNNTLFAITYSDGLCKSTDNGDTWSLVLDEDFNNVAVNGDEVYGSSESIVSGGVYYSDDNGVNWSNIGAGLPNIQVEEVTYVDDLGLFAKVRDYGLYTLDFNVTGWDNPTVEHRRIDFFPNPFTGSATLRLQVEEHSHLTITVYTLQGQPVEHSSFNYPAGGTVDIPLGKDLKPGTYLVNADLNGSRRSLQMIKTR